MLSQIERGEANPTLAVLWGLTQALKIDFARLVAHGMAHRQADAIEVVSVAHTPEIRSPDGAWRLRILSPPALAGRVEWYEVEIAPKAQLHSAPHAAGAVEHLTAWNDGLVVTAGERRQMLVVGETARYGADVQHEIANTSDDIARALMVVLYE
ncbi:MAG: cupin domain-containing protein [Bauldia sp.]